MCTNVPIFASNDVEEATKRKITGPFSIAVEVYNSFSHLGTVKQLGEQPSLPRETVPLILYNSVILLNIKTA